MASVTVRWKQVLPFLEFPLSFKEVQKAATTGGVAVANLKGGAQLKAQRFGAVVRLRVDGYAHDGSDIPKELR